MQWGPWGTIGKTKGENDQNQVYVGIDFIGHTNDCQEVVWRGRRMNNESNTCVTILNGNQGEE